MDTAIVILAGGNSRRMGRDKLVMSLAGQTLLESAVRRFKDVFGEIHLSVADVLKYPELSEHRIVDVIPGAGPLSGLHAALKSLDCEGVFLVAADLPFASAHAAKRIIELGGDKDACIIKLPDGKIEPLFGFYRKTLLPRCEEAIKSGDFRMSGIVRAADTRFVSPRDLGSLWDDKLILNINNPEDYEKLINT